MLAPVIAALAWLGMPAPAAASLIGELHGTVTGAGAPLPNVWVTLTPVTDQGNPRGTPKRTLTDGAGRYEFPEVYDRAVKVHVRAPLFGELVDTYWPDVHSFAQAGIIEISSWPVTADVDLPVGVSVSGRVVDAETGAAVPDARVSAVIAAAPTSGAVGVSDRTEDPGEFALSGLPPVPLTLRVRLPAGSGYLSVGPGEPSAGARIDGSGSTSGVVVGLRRGAEVRGTVRDDTGAPAGGATVKLVGCVPNCPLIVTADDSGAYRMVGVPPGSRLAVVAWKGTQLLKQWYPGRDNASQASDLTLGAGEVLDGIDFALTRGAFMTVDVRAADSSEPLTGAIVQLISSTDPFEHYFALQVDRRSGTDAPGTRATRLLHRQGDTGRLEPRAPPGQPAAGPGCCAPRDHRTGSRGRPRTRRRPAAAAGSRGSRWDRAGAGRLRGRGQWQRRDRDTRVSGRSACQPVAGCPQRPGRAPGMARACPGLPGAPGVKRGVVLGRRVTRRPRGARSHRERR